MPQHLSDKLRILSLVSIILVLYIHSGFHADEISGMTANNMTQGFISGMLGRCAVPLFYMISGYLFFLSVPNGMASIKLKMTKRVRTLLIPYIIGCMFFVAFFIVLDMIPGTQRFMNGSVMPLFKKPMEEIFISIFFAADNGNPCAFQLWFLRDLIALVCLSPAIYIFLKYGRWIFVAICFGLTFTSKISILHISLFWFVFGAALTNVNISKIGRGGFYWICGTAFLFISAYQLQYDNNIWDFFRIPITLLGITAIWTLYDRIVPENFKLSDKKWLNTTCGFTFFIYLFHEPTLNIIRKIIVFILGRNETGYMISYIMSPWIFVACAVTAGIIMKKYCGDIYRISTGGR